MHSPQDGHFSTRAVELQEILESFMSLSTARASEGQGRRIWHTSKSELEREYAKKNSNVLLHGSRNMLKQSPRILPVRFELQASCSDCGTIPSVPLLASSVALARMPRRPCCHEAQLKLCSINLAKRKDEPEIQDGGTWPQSSEAKQQQTNLIN